MIADAVTRDTPYMTASHRAPMPIRTFSGMALKTTRRPRGTGAGRVAVFAEVEPATKARLDDIVAATGAPKWAVIEALIEHAELDAAGRPVWWPQSAQQEVLDVSA